MSPVASADASEGLHQLSRIESTGSLDLSQTDNSQRGKMGSVDRASMDLGCDTSGGQIASHTAATGSSSSGNDLNDVAISIKPSSALQHWVAGVADSDHLVDDNHTSHSSNSRSSGSHYRAFGASILDKFSSKKSPVTKTNSSYSGTDGE